MRVREGDITSALTVLSRIPWPHRDVTVGKYKARFHEALAYLGSESMWDMPGNKRPSLSPRAGQGDLFQPPQIALCFLNWQTPATFDRNDMQLAGGLLVRPPFSRKIVLNLVHKKFDGGPPCPPQVCVISGCRRGVFRSLQITPAWETLSVCGQFHNGLKCTQRW